MAEALNLPPLHVHAIRVPVRKTATSIGDSEEMFVQQGENGGVQVDAFWRDAMGNEQHDSKEFQEDEYEAIREYYFRTEQATLPPFSSFKSGNTVGRVVGETAPAAVPATQANPPIEAQTDTEQGWWKGASPWVHNGLDVLGFIPGLGAIPDLINSGIYAAEGDAANAALSAAAAVPFAGDAFKGGVLVGKGISKAVAYSGTEIVEKATKKSSQKLSQEVIEKPSTPKFKPRNEDTPIDKGKSGATVRGGRLEVKCFKKPEHLDDSEFMRQLKEQEDAINSMNAATMIERHMAIKAAGGTKALRDPKAQTYARKAFEQKRLRELGKNNIWGEAAEKQIALELKDLAATHRLDIIAGGDPKDVSGMGGKGANSSIGPQWKGTRSNSLKTHAEEMIKEGKSNEKMHVKLKKC